jgi:hypothetical protein
MKHHIESRIIQTCPDSTTFSKKDLDKKLSSDISDEELDKKTTMIMSTFRENIKIQYSVQAFGHS